MVACEGHPLLVPRVRRYLDHELNLRDTQQAAWRRHWTVETLAALEGHLADHKDTGRFCHGDTPTLADICMVGHVTVAVTQQIDLAPCPTVKRIFETAMALPEFAKSPSAGAAGHAGGDAKGSRRAAALPSALSPCERSEESCLTPSAAPAAARFPGTAAAPRNAAACAFSAG